MAFLPIKACIIPSNTKKTDLHREFQLDFSAFCTQSVWSTIVSTIVSTLSAIRPYFQVGGGANKRNDNKLHSFGGPLGPPGPATHKEVSNILYLWLLGRVLSTHAATSIPAHFKNSILISV